MDSGPHGWRRVVGQRYQCHNISCFQTTSIQVRSSKRELIGYGAICIHYEHAARLRRLYGYVA